MTSNAFVKGLKENKELLLILFAALLWFTFRTTATAALCSVDPCWFEPTDWPALLEGTPTSVLALSLVILFAIPFGRMAIGATIIGIQVGLAHGFSVLAVTLLFFLATTSSIFLTWHVLALLLKKPGKGIRAWLKKVRFLKNKLKWLRKSRGTFVFLAMANAVSSQLYVTAIALLFEEKEKDAVPALIAGSLVSYFIPLLLLFTAYALTLDGITAFFVILALFELVRGSLAKALP